MPKSGVGVKSNKFNFNFHETLLLKFSKLIIHWCIILPIKANDDIAFNPSTIQGFSTLISKTLSLYPVNNAIHSQLFLYFPSVMLYTCTPNIPKYL